MSTIRPVGSGRGATASPFVRTIATPKAGLLLISEVGNPRDWTPLEGDAEANLGHALGWTCEIRKGDVVLLNPLGEGHVRADVPGLSVEWLTHVRQDGSCALFLGPPAIDAGFPELSIAGSVESRLVVSATVRTAIAEDYGSVAPIGRNQPCHCGSGRKFKHCHG